MEEQADTDAASERPSSPLPPGPVLRALMRSVDRLGWRAATLVGTATVVALSVAITAVIHLARGLWPLDHPTGHAIAALVPLLLATPSIAVTLRLVAYLLKAKRQLKEEIARRELAEARLVELAARDELTGLANRRAFMDAGAQVVALARRQSRWLSLLALDLDGFKAANDRDGHLAGDQILCEVAHVLRAHLRSSDLPARFGGDELVVLLPETDTSDARLAAERIRAAVEASCRGVTVSIGLAASEGTAADLDEMLERADRALYAAKRQGKNRVALAAARFDRPVVMPGYPLAPGAA